MSIYDELGNVHIDMLKEIGNIGTGNAATALSMMTSKKVEITVPSVSIVDVSQIPFFFRDPEKVTIGIQLPFHEELNGKLLLLFDSDPGRRILELLIGFRNDDLTCMDEMQKSVFSEIGNIVCGSYLVSLTQFSDLFVNSDVPQITVDMVSAIVAESCLTYAEEEDKTILIETNFEIEDQSQVEAYLFLILEPKSVEKLLHSLGM
ncbi:MAG TPA: CheY-P phosphatase CheC [Thermotogota bacterium]|nr:CheY-P phosphatase CheC [Thermotogota bacterium]HRW93142.1 CheY-P phosphatase CheC [Thermotogota bacterium]